MKRMPDSLRRKTARTALRTSDEQSTAVAGTILAGRLIAALARCDSCHQWWASSEPHAEQTELLLRLVEPHSETYLWQDYHGWYGTAEALVCPNCGQAANAAEIELRFDDHGRVLWPAQIPLAEAETLESGQAPQGNPFLEYVAGSAAMAENIRAIAMREEQRADAANGYAADIADIRDLMQEQRIAFKRLVNGYAPLLPPGWRVMADYSKWVEGNACAGFLHGEIQPDASLMIGGGCRTVAELEVELDRLFRYVVA